MAFALLALGWAWMEIAGLAETDFDRGNRLHEQGKHRDAMAAYASVWTNGQTSVALHFNWGCAALRTNELGEAVWQFHRARRLAPRDPEVIAHLAHARRLAAGGPDLPEPPYAWGPVPAVSLTELAWAAAAGSWLTFLALAGAGLWPHGRERFRPARRLGMACLILALPLYGWQWYRQVGSRPAVVMAKQVSVRLAPFSESQEAFKLNAGTDVWVDHEKENWWQVRDAVGRQGWLLQDTVREINRNPSLP